jgi:RNA polymerase sigma factor (sigma-70 family)
MALSEQSSDLPIGHLLRELTPQVLGIVVRRFRDFAAAEDAVQEASIAALLQWPRAGVPDNPRAWLTQVACRRMTDQIRRESARRRRETQVAEEAVRVHETAFHAVNGEAVNVDQAVNVEDDTLVLLFMCCHPALTPSSAIALTLRAVGGLTTAEIASAFLVPETTMAQRISRAKQAIRGSGIPFQLPNTEERETRLRSVLHVLYLIFNEGYTATSGPHLRRADLSEEGIRLARMALRLQTGNAEIAGLLALMLLTDARRHARTGLNDELIPLSRQDRTLWDREQIAEGVALLSLALPKGSVGPYQLQAAIAAVHDEAARPKDTHWPQILALYELLKRMSDNPMVMLNHAIAAAMVHGPREGLNLLDVLKGEPHMTEHRIDAVRAHLLEMAGDSQAAMRYYRAAAGNAANLAERNYLLMQSARLASARGRIRGMIIRPAGPEDALGIATIHVEAWRVAWRGIVPDEYLRALSIEQRHAGWRQILEAGESVWVAEDEDKTVGWISAARSRDVDASQSTGEIWAVYVHPDHWGKGVGRALYAAAEEELRRQGFTDVTLWVLKDNERAQHFYVSTGLVRDACEDRIVQLGGKALREVRMRKHFV